MLVFYVCQVVFSFTFLFIIMQTKHQIFGSHLRAAKRTKYQKVLNWKKLNHDSQVTIHILRRGKGGLDLFCLFSVLKVCLHIKELPRSTGCLNMLCQTSNHFLGIKNTLLSHKNGICTFMRYGNLTYDAWIWLKITSLSSTASVLNFS